MYRVGLNASSHSGVPLNVGAEYMGKVRPAEHADSLCGTPAWGVCFAGCRVRGWPLPRQIEDGFVGQSTLAAVPAYHPSLAYSASTWEATEWERWEANDREALCRAEKDRGCIPPLRN